MCAKPFFLSIRADYVKFNTKVSTFMDTVQMMGWANLEGGALQISVFHCGAPRGTIKLPRLQRWEEEGETAGSKIKQRQR